MTPLRKSMIAAMRQRGFSPRTHESYLAAVSVQAVARYGWLAATARRPPRAGAMVAPIAGPRLRSMR